MTTAEQPETTEPRPVRRDEPPKVAPPAPRPLAAAVDAPSPTGPLSSAGAPAPDDPPAGAAPEPSVPPASTPIGADLGATAPPRVVPARRPPRAPRIRSAPRRTRVVVRKIAPLSVLKFSLLFYLCVMLIVLFAMAIVYGILSAGGAIDSLETVLGYVFGTGTTSTGGAEPIEIDGGAVFTWSLIGGLIAVVIWSAITVFIAMLYNLISDIIGGIEVTLAEKPH
jgi:hypothetical protein